MNYKRNLVVTLWAMCNRASPLKFQLNRLSFESIYKFVFVKGSRAFFIVRVPWFVSYKRGNDLKVTILMGNIYSAGLLYIHKTNWTLRDPCITQHKSESARGRSLDRHPAGALCPFRIFNALIVNLSWMWLLIYYILCTLKVCARLSHLCMWNADKAWCVWWMPIDMHKSMDDLDPTCFLLWSIWVSYSTIIYCTLSWKVEFTRFLVLYFCNLKSVQLE